MQYQDFIQGISQCQTARIKPVNIPESSCPATLPLAFQSLFPDIISIIEQNFNELSYGQPSICVFGLQATGVAIQSDLPIKMDRILIGTRSRTHLTCSLYYLPADKPLAEKNWGNYKSVVIDFTDGVVMDHQQYLSMLSANVVHGKVFGRINGQKLARAWDCHRAITSNFNIKDVIPRLRANS